MLVEREGEIVTREEIQKKLWPNDTIVEFDHSINVAIRQAAPGAGRFRRRAEVHRDVARRGYRLMVPVEWVETPADELPVTRFPAAALTLRTWKSSLTQPA